MVVQYHAEVVNIGLDDPQGQVEVMLDIERNNVRYWTPVYVDLQTLKDEGIKKGDKLIIHLSKKLKYDL